jgi:POB3-like N-terminal PH domain
LELKLKRFYPLGDRNYPIGEMSSFADIGLFGSIGLGTLALRDSAIEWKGKETPYTSIKATTWTVFGNKAHLKISTDEGKVIRFDGFSKNDKSTLAQLLKDRTRCTLETETVSVRLGSIQSRLHLIFTRLYIPVG